MTRRHSYPRPLSMRRFAHLYLRSRLRYTRQALKSEGEWVDLRRLKQIDHASLVLSGLLLACARKSRTH